MRQLLVEHIIKMADYVFSKDTRILARKQRIRGLIILHDSRNAHARGGNGSVFKQINS